MYDVHGFSDTAWTQAANASPFEIIAESRRRSAFGAHDKR
jgi:hypothetical protein